jgi:hypothetical protein
MIDAFMTPLQSYVSCIHLNKSNEFEMNECEREKEIGVTNSGDVASR